MLPQAQHSRVSLDMARAPVGPSLPLMERDNDVVTLYEDTPSYEVLKNANVLTTRYRRSSVDDIFTGTDLRATSTRENNLIERAKCCFNACCLYTLTHTETFVPAGHVGFVQDVRNDYLFLQPGMHNIRSLYTRETKPPSPLRDHIQHGNRTIVIVEQGYLGYAMDNGQPVLLPPGIHVWTSESLEYKQSVGLDNHVVALGPMTLVTVDEGYAADNGKQRVLPGGNTHLLRHKNHRFEKFISLKIQTDNLQKIEATSADNINMKVDSTVNWRIFDAEVAATMAAETMAVSGKFSDVAADITKLRNDVLKQALASLAAFIGSVNYSESFHMSAAAAGTSVKTVAGVLVKSEEQQEVKKFVDNPMYNEQKMSSSVEHANRVTRTYGVEIISINIISAMPSDAKLTMSLASGAVAAAEALQAETAARGKANAVRIAAEASAQQARIEAQGQAEAQLARSRAISESTALEAKGFAEADVIKAEAHARAIRELGAALDEKGGKAAMGQRVAEMYVNQLADMARNSKMVIVPDKPNDINGVLASAFGISAAVGQITA
ncbi:hypothetical protein AB1Y20_014048 [Prymnesium parvum]|uniref:STML2-like C-terminal extension domain-containing protein n=1 Tax=Prymnesium parvum TaxID=97485 RepID=A0AB34IEP1_PRYPA